MTERLTDGQRIARAINDNLTSPNESDRNGEPANAVDGLFAIASAIGYLADVIKEGR